jgi:hypothetical protein
MSVTEQHMNIKFCFAAEITSGDLPMLQQAYGDTAMKMSQIYDQHKASVMDTSVDERPRSFRPSTATKEAHVKSVRVCEK